MGPKKFCSVAAPIAADIAGAQLRQNLVEYLDRVAAGCPLVRRTQQIPFGYHLENRADILRHAAVYQDETALQFVARLFGNFGGAENVMYRQQPAAADAEFGITSSAAEPSIIFIPGQTPPESCQPPPLPPSHSPRIARAATSRRSGSVSDPVSDATCPVARMHTEISDARRFVDTASREPFGMSFT